MKKPSINSLKHFIRATCQGTPMMEAGQLACTVLFEGLSPVNKARRTIRSILPVPPGGWDAPAQTPDGKPVVSQNGNELSWNLKMEAAIRDEFFHSGDIAEKFEPGVARIAYQDLHLWPENVADFRQQQPAPRTDRIPSLKAILRMLTGAHQDDFDGDLNGLSFDALEQNYGTHKNRNSDDYNEGSGIEDTGESKYRIVRVKNFEESEQYARMFPDDSTRWCICRSRQYWNQYTRRGQNTAYFLIAPDAEDIPAVPGENCPLDRYGLSMIGIMIDPEGGIDHCCCRWNYAHNATDGILNRKQIEELIGRPLDKACPHLEPDDSDSELTVAAVIAKIKNGMDPMEAWTTCGFTRTDHTLWDGTAVIFSHPHVDDDGYETTSETIANAKTLAPMFNFELVDWDIIDDNLIWGKYKTDETDYYGEDVYNDALLRRDGYCTDLATSDEENSDYVMFYQSRIDYIRKIDGLPGLYLLRLDNSRDCDFPYAIIDSEGNSKVHMHGDIEIYPASQLICCDLDSEYVCDNNDYGEDGGVAVYHYDESGNLKEYIGTNSTSDTLDYLGSSTFHIAPDPNHPEKKSGEDIHIIYVDDGAIYTIIGGKEKLLFNENVTSTERVTLKNTSDDIYRITRDAETENGYEDEDVLYDLSQDRILATGLKDMDINGMYTDSEGLRNQYGINGPMLKKGYRHIEERVIQKYCAAGDNFYVCADSPDANEAIFIDQKTNEPVYDHPVPKDAVPVTKDLYIAPLPDEADGSHKYAYFSAKDGQQTSEPFIKVRIDSGTACTAVTSKTGESRYSNGTIKIIDLATGKDYPFTLSDLSLVFFFNWPGIKAKAVQKFEEVTGEPGDDAKNSTYIFILSNANDDTRTIAACCRGVWVFSDIGWKPKLAVNKNSSLVTWIDDTTKRYIVYDIATNKSIDFNSNNNAVFFLRRFVDSQGYGMSSENFALATKKYEMEHPDKTWMDWVKEYEQNEGKEYGPR